MGHMGPWMGPMGHMGYGPMGGPPMPPPMGGPPQDGQIMFGTISKYDTGKGYGFISCETVPENKIFFLRSELPPDTREAAKDEVVGLTVEFEIGHRDDGKLR